MKSVLALERAPNYQMSVGGLIGDGQQDLKSIRCFSYVSFSLIALFLTLVLREDWKKGVSKILKIAVTCEGQCACTKRLLSNKQIRWLPKLFIVIFVYFLDVKDQDSRISLERHDEKERLFKGKPGISRGPRWWYGANPLTELERKMPMVCSWAELKSFLSYVSSVKVVGNVPTKSLSLVRLPQHTNMSRWYREVGP